MTKYVIFSFFLVLIYPLGVDLYLTGLTAIASDLNASEVTLHHAFSIYLMGMVSSMLIAGWCSDNLGRKPVILFGTLIFFLASLSAGLSITEKQFLISRFFQGSGSGFCYVVTFAILRDTLTEQQRAKVLSMINGITCIIPVLAPVLGFIILLYCEWSMMFYLMGAYSLLVFIFCFLGIKETYHKKEIKNKKVNLSVIKPTTDSFFTRYFLSRLLISCLGMAVILTYVNISPIVVMQQMNYSTGEYSILMTSLAMISMTISFLMPKILMKYRYKHILSVGFICFGIGIKWLSISPSAVSKALAKLRIWFDDPLFIRSPQGLIPTPLSLSIEDSLSDFINISHHIANKRNTEVPVGLKFNLVLETPLHQVMLPSLPQQILSHYPKSTLQIKNWEYNSLSNIIDGEVDIGLVGREYYSRSKELLELLPDVIDYEILFDDIPLVYLHKNHPLMKMKWDLNNFLSFSQVSTEYDKQSHWALDNILKEMNKSRQIAITYTSFEQSLFMISQPDHQLITCAPGYCRYYVKTHFPDIVTLPIPLPPVFLEQLHLPFVLLWHKRNSHNTKIIWLRNTIRKSINQQTSDI